MVDEEELLSLLALRRAGISSHELFALFSPTFTELNLGLPSRKAAYQSEIASYWDEARAELEACQQAEIKVLPFISPSYPSSLADLHLSCPLVLYLRGNVSLLDAPHHLAIVGTRYPTIQGYQDAYQIAKEEAQRGAVIISGLAIGCDEAAHRGALDAGGRTIAVVATGLDQVYPTVHRPLQERLLAHGGLVISEYPLGTSLEPYRLIQRNRILAGLAKALLVVECGRTSGTMHAVRFAERCHRPVYALASHSLPSRAGNELLLSSARAQLYPALGLTTSVNLDC